MTDPSGSELDAAGWRRVEEIFHRLSGEAPAQWRALVDAACGDDPRVGEEVLALLGAVDNGSQLEGAIRGAMGDWLEGTAKAFPEPEQIGPFQILERLGEGGLAVVYLAERHEPFHQRVAIKLLKRGLETEEVLRRIQLEGQILAKLEHPNVARLLDGGWTDDGRPYFVLEVVDGEPIDRYCDQQHLDIEARLRLFERVCGVVQQAHNRLIVHRDLKPSNLLVTADGEPKLLDFGIAKLLDTSHWPQVGATAARTRPGASWMTPDYAAPEQVAGGELTTAVDVYALGVVLYQLLCGHLPRELAGKSPAAIEHSFEGPLSPPSHRLDADAAAVRGGSLEVVARTLSGDLDNLVAKALDRDPERRYASVQQMAEDVQRFLRSEPLIARPDAWTYRATKFIHRHRRGVAAVAAIFLSLVVGVVAAMLGLHQAQRQRSLAEQQRSLAEQRLDEMAAVVDFTTGMFEIVDPGEARGSAVTAREILDRGAERIGDQLAGQPVVTARMMDTMGQVYRNLGLYGSAHDLLDQATSLWFEAGDEHRLDALVSQRHLAAVLFDQGAFDEASAILGEIRAQERRLAGQLAGRDADLATTLHLSGLVARELGDPDAESLLHRALDRRLEAFGAEHLAVAESRNDLGEVVDDLEAAREHFERALAIRRASLGPDHPLVAETLHNLATLHEETGNLEAAEDSFRKVLAIRRKVLGNVHRDVAVTLNNLAKVLHGQGRHEAAVEPYREAVRVARQTIPSHPTTASFLNNLALELWDVQRLDEAIDVMAEAVDLRLRLFGQTIDQAQLEFNYAALLASAERRQDAIRALENNLDSMRALGVTDFPLSYPLTLLADLLADEGACERSRRLVADALHLRRDLAAEDPLRQRVEEVAAKCSG